MLKTFIIFVIILFGISGVIIYKGWSWLVESSKIKLLKISSIHSPIGSNNLIGTDGESIYLCNEQKKECAFLFKVKKPLHIHNVSLNLENGYNVVSGNNTMIGAGGGGNYKFRTKDGLSWEKGHILNNHLKMNSWQWSWKEYTVSPSKKVKAYTLVK